MIGTTDVWAIDEVVLREALELAQHSPDSIVSDDVEEGVSAEQEANIRTISISGVIDKSAGFLASALGVAADPMEVRREVAEAREDDSVDGVLFSIDSPGGKVPGVEMLADDVRALSEEKPTLAHANGKMASAAYWIGAQADERLAIPSARLGSIAVVQQIKSIADYLDSEGIDVRIVRSGEYKQRPNPAEQLTSEDVSLIEDRVESIHGRFVAGVSKGLGISTDRAEDLADGRVYLPSAAQEAGLIDGTATPEEALAALTDTIQSQSTQVSTTMSDDSTDQNLEARVDQMEEDVSTILDAVTTDEEAEAEEADAEPEADERPSAERRAAENLVDQYEDRYPPAERETYVELAMSSPDAARSALEAMQPNAAESASMPSADSEEQTTHDDLEKFPEDNYIGRNDGGEMIATNEEDVKVFRQLGLDFEDRT